MASYRKRAGKWEVRIRKNKSHAICKTFIAKEDAIKWARESESKIEKGLLEDLSQANAITLKELLQQYKSEESVKKKGGYSEGTKINKLCREKIAQYPLSKITPLKIKKFRDAWLETHNPSTVNKYLTIISCSIDYAMQELGIYLPGNACKNVKRPKEPEFSSDAIEHLKKIYC